MKKQKRLMALGITAAMAAGLLSGCGTKATPENLLRDMQKNAEKTESALLNFKMDIAMGDGTDDVSLGMDMNMETTTEPEASHGKGAVSISMSGMDFSVEMEMYSVQEDGEYVTYTLMEDQWTKEVSDDGEMTGEVDSIADNVEEYADQFELAEDLVTVNDKECFELTGELDGDLFSEMMQTDMMDSLAGYGIDEEALSDMMFPCTIDIYKDSILPARLYFDMTESMAPLMEDSGVTVSECYVDMTFMEYDTVEEITVPDEAVSAAEDGSDSGLDLPQDDTYEDESVVTPAEPAEQSSELGDSWESYTVQVNDTVITLPCTIADLEAAGVKMDTEYTPSDYVVNAGEYELAWFMVDSGDYIMVDMINTGSEPKEVKDCLVGSVYADAYSMTEGGLTVIFPGGIQIGTPEADLLAAYGEADNVYEDEEYGNSYYWYGDDMLVSGFNASIDPETGLVESLSIQNEG
ncbi:DUF6612 family protein [Mediterraneibacter glycyrrhizinilyticus]|uniref:DUF6612 family protein n=1 Tax=Mediterraneibacter glycyrrhizinilyticus TaxID=342942 RepID=UPI0025A35645|nr:DUF6612 family protein [Mediterraneibacter glycyrrhizinilyticus]MDM8126590.1 hypothetical protein [Mediterraneibacter glycyrrhizinilyticus]